MYKIALIVVVFAFALQGAVSGPVAEAGANENVEAVPDVAMVYNQPADATSPAPATTPKTSGASTSQTCLLLVQISSLALITKHLIL